jgi:hypothetical protein
VLIDQSLLQNKISFTENNFTKYARTGGHTFMTGKQRSKYINIYCFGAMSDVLNISVRLLMEGTDIEQNNIVWNSMLTVAKFLATHTARSTTQAAINANVHATVANYEHEVVAGVMFPLLVMLHLGSIVEGGICVSVDTYNGKMQAYYELPPSAFVSEFTVSDADIASLHLQDTLSMRIPLMVHRLNGFMNKLWMEPFCTDSSADATKFYWGVGCTVETVCQNTIKSNSSVLETELSDTSNHIDINVEVAQTDCLNTPDDCLVPMSSDAECARCTPSAPTSVDICSNFAKEQNMLQSTKLSDKNFKSVFKGEILDETRYEYRPAFTVVCIELPPHAQLRSTPSQWFKGAMDIANETRTVDHVNATGVANEDVDLDDSASDEDTVSVGNPTDAVQTRKRVYPNVAVACKSHVEYPTFGGCLPMETRPMTIECAKHLKTSSFKGMDGAIRTQCYGLSSRYACGEYNVPLKCSAEVGRVYYDVYGDSKHATFDMVKCIIRKDKFVSFHEQTLSEMTKHGSPGRVEIAFSSPSYENNLETLTNGIRDTVAACLKYTQSYEITPIVRYIRFILSGVTFKLDALNTMLNMDLPDPAIYDEILCIRLEVAAILEAWHSGFGKLRNKLIPSAKNAHMAARVILNRLPLHTSAVRDDLLTTPLTNYYDLFQSNLVDVNGLSHRRINNPDFIRKFEESFVQKYVCGQACNKCFRFFNTVTPQAAFATHSCVDVAKGELTKVTSKAFLAHKDKLFQKLEPNQRRAITVMLTTSKNLFLTGFAGTGKSLTLVVAIMFHLVTNGLSTFAVIAPTKVAAGIVGGSTYHSFLGLKVKRNKDGTEIKEVLKSYSEVKEEAILHANVMARDYKEKCLGFQFALQIIFIDECGMLSHDHLVFLDWFLRTVRLDTETAFGGVRLFMVGDVMQLSPYVTQPTYNDYSTSRHTRHKVYFFESLSFLKGNFSVLYLHVNHRQGTNNSYARVLNDVRDGINLKESCNYINEFFGNKVNKLCIRKVIHALYSEFDEEIIRLQEEDNFTHQMGIRKDGLSKIETLLHKLKCRWTNLHLREYYNHYYEHVVANGRTIVSRKKNVAINSFYATPYFKTIKQHIRRLPVTDELDLVTIITVEHTEINSITKAYNNVRRGNSTVCNSDDKTFKDGLEIKEFVWSPAANTFMLKESKMAKSLSLSVGQSVAYVVNTVDVNAANNLIGTVVRITASEDGASEIWVAPDLANVELVPHPICVTRKEVTFEYSGMKNMTLNLNRTQFPLKPADGVTVNSMQGVTRKKAHGVNCHRITGSSFGKAYVALSRATDESEVFPVFPICPADIVACPIALKFDRHHRNQADDLTLVDYELEASQDGLQCEIRPVRT